MWERRKEKEVLQVEEVKMGSADFHGTQYPIINTRIVQCPINNTRIVQCPVNNTRIFQRPSVVMGKRYMSMANNHAIPLDYSLAVAGRDGGWPAKKP